MSLLMQRWKKSPTLADVSPPLPTSVKDRALRLADSNGAAQNKEEQNSELTGTELPTPQEMAQRFYKESGLSDKSFDSKDIKRANEVNAKMQKLGIARYAVCSPRGGLSYRAIRPSCIDKPNVGYVSPKDVSEYLQKHYGFSLKELEDRTISDLKQKISTFIPKKGTRAPVEIKQDTTVHVEKVEHEIPKMVEKAEKKTAKSKPKTEKDEVKESAATSSEADEVEKGIDELTNLMKSALNK